MSTGSQKAADGWYRQVSGKVYGPMTGKALLQQAKAGVIQGDTLVRKGASGPWIQASKVKGLITAPVEPSPIMGNSSGQVLPIEPIQVSPAVSRGEAATTTKPCPFCGETILAVATKCKHCGEFFDSAIARNITKTKGDNDKDGESDKRILPLLIFFWCFSLTGLHAFYAGQIQRGRNHFFLTSLLLVSWCLTNILWESGIMPAFLVLTLVVLLMIVSGLFCDFIRIVTGTYKDGVGRQISKWT